MIVFKLFCYDTTKIQYNYYITKFMTAIIHFSFCNDASPHPEVANKPHFVNKVSKVFDKFDNRYFARQDNFAT